VGDQHACALTTGGAVLCWGSDDFGQLGDGLVEDEPQHQPVAVSGLSSGVAAIAAGTNETCAVTAAGGVLCWGENAQGALGDGSAMDSAVPVAVSGLSSGVAAVGVGTSYACALTTGGAVLCWGDNTYGQLGIGSTLSNSAVPVAVSGLSSGVAAISTAPAHACALTTAGAILCWGNNDVGQLGTGMTGPSSLVPVGVVEP
jgi:alpha-tubulin suppressor-like RCC1 family protein